MARLTSERTPDQLGHEWFVERVGAGALEFRFAQQEQWERAQSVRDGRQPRIDPDGFELEEIDEGLRVYRSHDAPGTIDGRDAILTQRLAKRLVDGIWESEFEVESYRYAGEPFARR